MSVEPKDFQHALAVSLLLADADPERPWQTLQELRGLSGCTVLGYWMGVRLYLESTKESPHREAMVRMHNTLAKFVSSLLPGFTGAPTVPSAYPGICDPTKTAPRAGALLLVDLVDVVATRTGGVLL